MRHIFLLGGLFSMVSLGAEPEAREWKAEDGTQVLYRWSAPATLEAGKKYPLVMFLHGSGERGTDNKAQLKNGVSDILKQAQALKEPCFLIAPQCPPDQWWTDRNQAKDGKADLLMSALLALVDQTFKDHPVDEKRFYVTGLSMGGYGTWSMLAAVPKKIAAAIPICGGGNPKTAAAFKDVPIWAFHGEKDNVVIVQTTRDMIAALEAAGGKPKATYYPDLGHDSWTETYQNPEVIRWLFEQRK